MRVSRQQRQVESAEATVDVVHEQNGLTGTPSRTRFVTKHRQRFTLRHRFDMSRRFTRETSSPPHSGGEDRAIGR